MHQDYMATLYSGNYSGANKQTKLYFLKLVQISDFEKKKSKLSYICISFLQKTVK